MEKDVILIAEGVAYVFEIKASVPTLKMRRGGDISDYCAVLKPVTCQAYHAAQAVIAGKAYYDRDLKKLLPNVRRVYPCAIGFEFNPLRSPYSDFVEQELEAELKEKVFSNRPSIAPMQYFDVQQIEMWDDLFDLPNEAAKLFAAIRLRSENVLIRFDPHLPCDGFRGDYDTRPGIIREMTDHAELSTKARLKQMVS